jgi:hypothetical protein
MGVIDAGAVGLVPSRYAAAMSIEDAEPGLPAPSRPEGRQKEPWSSLSTLFRDYRDGKRSAPAERDPHLLTTSYFPRADKTPQHLRDLRDTFLPMHEYAFERGCEGWNVQSNHALKIAAPQLTDLHGYSVENWPKGVRNRLPILFGPDETTLRYHDADAYHEGLRTIIEVEAGTATANNAYLKDIFEASMVVNADYLVLAVRKIYQSKTGGASPDYKIVYDALDTIYSSGRIQLDLRGILLIGY